MRKLFAATSVALALAAVLNCGCSSKPSTPAKTDAQKRVEASRELQEDSRNLPAPALAATAYIEWVPCTDTSPIEVGDRVLCVKATPDFAGDFSMYVEAIVEGGKEAIVVWTVGIADADGSHMRRRRFPLTELMKPSVIIDKRMLPYRPHLKPFAGGTLPGDKMGRTFLLIAK